MSSTEVDNYFKTLNTGSKTPPLAPISSSKGSEVDNYFAKLQSAPVNKVQKYQQEAKQAQAESDKANSFGGLLKNTLKGVGNNLYNIVGGLALPGATPEELRNKQIMKDTILGLPKAFQDMLKQLNEHPIKTAQDVVGGATRGISDEITGIITNLFVPKADQEATSAQIKATLDKYLGESNPNNNVQQGFQTAGHAAPYIAAGGILGEAGGALGGRFGGALGAETGTSAATGLGSNLLGEKTGQIIGSTLGNAGGFVGVGQASIPTDATLSERADRATQDLVALGLFTLGSKAFNFTKTRILDGMKKKVATEVPPPDSGTPPTTPPPETPPIVPPKPPLTPPTTPKTAPEPTKDVFMDRTATPAQYEARLREISPQQPESWYKWQTENAFTEKPKVDSIYRNEKEAKYWLDEHTQNAIRQEAEITKLKKQGGSALRIKNLQSDLRYSKKTATEAQAELNKFTAPEPTIVPKVEQSPLLKEAGKYKSAEDFVKAKPVIEVPISEVNPTPGHTADLMGNKPSEAKGALTVHINEAGKIQIMDGNHRYFEAIKRGDKTIPIQFSEDIVGNYKGELDRFKTYFDKTKSQLTDFYNQSKAVGETKNVSRETPTAVAPKPIEAKADTQFNSRVFERMKAEHPQLEGDLGYDPIKLKADADKAAELIATDKQKAYDIAMGKETSTEMTSTGVNIALAEKALQEGNYDLYAKLIKNRSLEQTRRGQEISAERGSVTDNSTARYVKELIATRLEKLGESYLGNLKDSLRKKTGKTKATQVIDAEVAKLDSAIRNKKLTVKDALKLLDELACV